MILDRRAMLSGLIGCSAAASPLATPVTWATAPGENRLALILLRGALDGLALAEPYGDRDLRSLRPGLARGGDGLIDLDGRFGLHPEIGAPANWFARGELAVVHAVSTPYRDERSHFDGQDMLENGGANADGALTPGRDGWLNRALAHLPGAHAETAIAVGRERMLVLEGAAPAGAWAPNERLSLATDERRVLEALYRSDPLFAAAFADAARLGEIAASEKDGGGGHGADALAAFAARMLNGEARIAAFSLGGWDTHRNQAGAIRRPLRMLGAALERLKDDLGRNWGRTLVIAVTEFGRTARENGTRGTDHGTAGAALLAGGALAAGRVFGTWPGLGRDALYQERDLAPTEDVRRYAGHALQGLFGLPTSAIERNVFPGLELGADPRILA